MLQHLLNGLTVGSIYALVALGYTLVYGILKFINFAHGDVLMIGTYVALMVFKGLKSFIEIPFAFGIAVMAGMLSSALLGVVIERLAYRPLRHAPRLAPLISAIGVSVILSNTAALFFGTKSQRFDMPFTNTPIHCGSLVVTPYQGLILITAFVMMVLLHVFIKTTRTGKAMRASSENPLVAELMGVDTDRMIRFTFIWGSALGAIAGILVSLDYKVYPTLGSLIGLKAFIAAVVGGIGNISGAMLGGLLLGVLETYGVAVLGIPVGYKDTVAFVLLIIILLVRPSGLLGSNKREKV